MKKLRLIACLSILGAACGSTGMAFGDGGSPRVAVGPPNDLARVAAAELPWVAPVGMPAALETALAAAWGRAMDVELKREGQVLVYEVDVVSSRRDIITVTVDAYTGMVLDVGRDGDRH